MNSFLNKGLFKHRTVKFSLVFNSYPDFVYTWWLLHQKKKEFLKRQFFPFTRILWPKQWKASMLCLWIVLVFAAMLSFSDFSWFNFFEKVQFLKFAFLFTLRFRDFHSNVARKSSDICLKNKARNSESLRQLDQLIFQSYASCVSNIAVTLVMEYKRHILGPRQS